MIDLKKILTMSAKDYCTMVKRDLSEYKAVGVHVQGDLDRFLYETPQGAEAVVDYRFCSWDNRIFGSGTALILK